MRRTLVTFAGVLLLSVFVPNAWSQVRYVLTDLGTLGGTESWANAINNSGQIVGTSVTSDGAEHAFLYSGGSMSDLGTLSGGTMSGATAINDYGQIVGGSSVSGSAEHAFLFSGGSMQDIGSLSGYQWTSAAGINDSGQIVGTAFNYSSTGSQVQAFYYSGGTMLPVYDIFGGNASYAYSINNNGLCVGQAVTTVGYSIAYISSGAFGMSSLHSVSNSVANAINNNGQVVGYAETNRVNGIYHAFLSSSSSGMEDLGTLGSLYSFSEATAINDLGQIVGNSDTTTGGYDPFICNGTGPMEDLLDMIEPGSGCTFGQATGINDKGQIVGWGDDSNGNMVAVVLTPDTTPEPPTFVLLGVAAITLLGSTWLRRRSLRSTILISEQTCPCAKKPAQRPCSSRISTAKVGRCAVSAVYPSSAVEKQRKLLCDGGTERAGPTTTPGNAYERTRAFDSRHFNRQGLDHVEFRPHPLGLAKVDILDQAFCQFHGQRTTIRG